LFVDPSPHVMLSPVEFEEASIHRFIQEAKKNADGEIMNQISKKVVTIKAHPTQKMNEFIEKLNSPH